MPKATEIEPVQINMARNFAIEKHGNQRYGVHPYIFHLNQVAMILDNTYGNNSDTRVLMITAGLLHDVVEDTPVRISELKNLFGTGVADIVYAVTNELGRNRKEKLVKTMIKVRDFGAAAVAVKLADRIANTEYSRSQRNNGGSHYEMYQKEYPFFRWYLYHKSDNLNDLWDRLDKATEQ